MKEEDIVLSDNPKILEDPGCQTVLFVNTPEEQGKNKIFMYRSREEIYKDLLELTGTKEEDKGNSSLKESGIIVVFSPEGGDGKTLLALKRAGELSRNKRVLNEGITLSLRGSPSLCFGRKERILRRVWKIWHISWEGSGLSHRSDTIKTCWIFPWRISEDL